MDYTLNIYNNGTYICTLGANQLNYDNWIWWKLSQLIKAYCNQEITKINFEKAYDSIGFFYVLKDDNAEEIAENSIDFGKKTITLPKLCIYSFDQVKNNTPIEVIKKGDKYFARYDDYDEDLPMENVEFESIDLFNKQEVSFEEFEHIANFIMSIQEECSENDTDFILNNDCVLRLNNI